MHQLRLGLLLDFDRHVMQRDLRAAIAANIVALGISVQRLIHSGVEEELTSTSIQGRGCPPSISKRLCPLSNAKAAI